MPHNMASLVMSVKRSIWVELTELGVGYRFRVPE
jgi:hypothetical protein